ncbi:hypothetical protein Tco_1047430 [Tanacetum coccineum]
MIHLSQEALKNSCCKDKKRRLEVLQIKNNLKNSIYNILRKLKVFKVKIKNVLKELEVHKFGEEVLIFVFVFLLSDCLFVKGAYGCILADTEIISMIDIKVQHGDPSSQTSPLFTVLVSVIPESSTAPTTTIPPPISPFIPLPQQTTPTPTPTTTEATVSTISAPDSSTFTAFHQRLSDLENEVKIIRNVDHGSAIRAAIKSEVPTFVKEYLGTSLDDTLHKVIQRHTAELIKEHPVQADVVKVLQQQQKPQKSAADIHKIKIKHAAKQQERALYETMTASKSFNKHLKHKALYHALMESILADEYAMDKGVVDIQKKRKPGDADIDEDPPAGPDQGLKRRKTSKDVEQSKKAKSTRTSKGTTKSWPKSTGKSAQAEETVFEAEDTQVPQDLGEDMGNSDEPPVVKADPKDWFKKPERPPTPDPEWNECKTVDSKPTQKWLSDLAKAEKSSKTFDDLMSTPVDFNAFAMNRLQISDLTQDILIVPVDYFFNNDLAYLQGGSTGRTYTTSLTKTKDAKYDLQGIEDMSTKRIIAVTNVKVNIWYGYGHLEEIEVRRSDQQLYKFMEGDFPRLYLNDIKDMLLLIIQNRLFNLKGEDIVHLATTLRIFTRRIVIQKRVEDLQLGVESYQKKLNISRPLTHKAGITDLEPYTTYSNPQGVIYLDKLKRNRLMCSHELYKFSDGTLISVRDKLKDMLNNLEMGYTSVMPRMRWSNLDKKWSCIMMEDIDRQLLKRRLNPDSRLPNFNTGRILVPESQVVIESVKPTETSNTPESSKDSEMESLTPLPPLKNLQGASPSSEVMPLTFQPHSPKERPGLASSKSVDSSKISQNSKPKVQNTGSSKSLRPKPIQKPQLKCELCHYTNHSTNDCYRILYYMICKREDHRTSDHVMYTASLKRSENYKAQPYQYASPSKQILKAKAKPFPPCTHYGFNNHIHDDCRNYPECGICGSYDHFNSGHNRVIHISG